MLQIKIVIRCCKYQLQLSIIIVNYNVKFFLEQCLCSVIKAVQNLQTEIYVVDNNSTDNSKDFFRDRFPTVKFLWNETNVGFAKANNTAFSLAVGKYILFLNPDTIVPEDCFEKCISFLETHSEAGALGIRMIDGNGNFLRESKRSFPSPLTSFYKLSGLTWLFPKSKIFAKYYASNKDEKETHEVDVLAGAFMIIPKKVLEQTGTFDEAFFMYGEDIDLSYRIQKAGYNNFYFPEVSIIHFKGESTKKGSLNYVKMFYKAMSIFVKKHYGGSKVGLFTVVIQPAIFFRAMISVTAGFFKRISFSLRQIKNNEEGKERSQTIVIGTEMEFEEVQNLIKVSTFHERTLDRLELSLDEGLNADVYLNQLSQIIKEKFATQVILCEGNLSFRKIIEITGRMSKSLKIKFHAEGSKGIVGSET